MTFEAVTDGATTTALAEPKDSEVAPLPPWAVALTGQVTAERHGTVPAALVEDRVREAVSMFRDAPVREFLPVFVERRVRRRLGPQTREVAHD